MGAFIPRIVLTSGEPAGIGPDLCALIALKAWPCELLVLGDPDLLRSRAEKLGLSLDHTTADLAESPEIHRPGRLKCLPVQLKTKAVGGQLAPENASYVLETIKTAALGCLHGDFQAMVTGPVHKGIMNEAGITFTGHTEYIAELTGGDPVMMLAAPSLRVALATTHLPLSRVSQALSRERLVTVLRILCQDLKRRFAISQPRILVCGLNPHAGENGHLGWEEIKIIKPALQLLQQEGLNLAGPLPADTVFTPKHLDGADAVLAMYHDQGLPVLKYAGFGRAVNITLGLPIIRTSVDHGTALDLAGTGQIDTGSLEAAIKTAIVMAKSEALK